MERYAPRPAPPLEPARVSARAEQHTGAVRRPPGVAGERSDVQRAVGQQAVGGLAQTISLARPAQRQVIRRQVLANISLEDDAISDVIIGGRTPSPFTSTMGAHGTAWVAHVDQMRRILIGRSLPVAAQNLIELAEREQASGLLDLATMAPAAQQAAITRATGDVDTAKAALRLVKDGDNVAAIIQAVRRLIDQHLTLVNYLPTATVDGGDPSGHGEGSARTNLNTFEYLRAKVSNGDDIDEATETVSRSEFGKRLRREAAKNFTPKSADFSIALRNELWQLFAAETPTVFSRAATTPQQVQVWTLMVRNFLTTIREAYPFAYAYTDMRSPVEQLIGLDHALGQTMEQPSATVLKLVQAAIRGNLDVTSAVPNAAAVSDSDLRGATSQFQSSVFLKPDNTIGDVVLIGRTESPFSATMGRHTTAWAAHVDALRNALIGKTLGGALDEMLKRGRALMSDDSLSVSNLVDEKQHTKLASWYDALESKIDAIHQDLDDIAGGEDPFDDTELTALVEDLILHYMSFTNLLPFSTVNHGSVPAGRNEGRHRKFLLAFEADREQGVEVPAATRKLVLRNVLGLWDGETLDDYEAPEDFNLRDVDVDSAHDLYDRFTDDDHDSAYAIFRDTTFARFQRTIEEAYPYAYAESHLADLTIDQAADLQYEFDLRKGANQKKRKGANKSATRKKKAHLEV